MGAVRRPKAAAQRTYPTPDMLDSCSFFLTSATFSITPVRFLVM
jgi:hypothetical protein